MSSIRTMSRIEPGQFALVTGATYALCGIVFGVIIFLVSAAVPAATGAFGGMGHGWIMLIVFPVLYGIGGYIFGLIGAFVYNMVAGTVGGIKVTVSD